MHCNIKYVFQVKDTTKLPLFLVQQYLSYVNTYITDNDNSCEPNVSMKFTQIAKEAACFNLNLNDIPIL